MKNVLFILALLLLNIGSSAQGFWKEEVFLSIRHWGDKLAIFDRAACELNIIGDLEILSTGGAWSDITFTPNGKLYGIRGGEILEIDTATAEATSVCILPSSFWGPSLTYLNDSVLLTDRNDTLWAINLNTCLLSSLGVIGYEFIASDGDLTWYGNRDLYLVSRQRLFKINLNATGTAIDSSRQVGTDSIFPISWGLINVSTDGDGNMLEREKILSFTESTFTSVIDPFDLAVGEYCSFTFTEGITGATKHWRYIDTTTAAPDSGTMLSIIDKQASIIIYPNPSIDGILNLRSNVGLNIQDIHAFDLYGRQIRVSAAKIDENQIRIEFPADCMKALYILEVTMRDKTLRQKIVLEYY